MRTRAILREVWEERLRQDAKWGRQHHWPAEWIAVLAEEVGEAAQEVLRIRFGGASDGELKAELVQVAAVAVAIIEDLENGYCDAEPRESDF